MSKEVIIILIIAGIALFIWVPAIIWSVRNALKKGKKQN